MLSKLTPQQLNITIDPKQLGFDDASALLQEIQASKRPWIGQDAAYNAASFGLRMRQPGYHMLVIGESGSGRTSLMRELVTEALAQQAAPPDLVYLFNFQAPETPMLLQLHAGKGVEFRQLLDQFVRKQVRVIPSLLQGDKQSDAALSDSSSHAALTALLKTHLEQELASIRDQLLPHCVEHALFQRWITALVQEVLDNIDLFISVSSNEADGMQEAFFGRFRANLLVSGNGKSGAPVIYDDDPSYQSLFGGIEAASEHQSVDFMRLKAGHLLKANGGALIVHLEDLLADEQQGANPLMDKLGRVLRNRKVQIEDTGSASGSAALSALTPEPLPMDFKLILVASRDDYYHLHEHHEALLEHFLIKVEFAESKVATPEIYHQIACHIACMCQADGLPHFTSAAIARLLQLLHEWEEDQARVNLALGKLRPLVQEAAALAAADKLVDVAEVEAALAFARSRHDYAEQQIRDSILDGELLIAVHGRAAGRINGLTHIDMGDAAFGSPVQITACCYPGRHGIVNIDREVKLTGPQHDKGMLILQSWLSATFAHLAPLSLNASLVFEQEYHGVEGDSASCAELYALLSSLSGLPLLQGVAVTGALNQHGDVLPVGGVNEKIMGHFRLCEKQGLDGRQGVLLPARAMHVLLDKDIVNAVAAGKFHIYIMEHVLDGIAYLTDVPVGEVDAHGEYPADTVLGKVQHALKNYQDIYFRNFNRHYGQTGKHDE